MEDLKRFVWTSLKEVVTEFVSEKDPIIKNVVNMLKNLKAMGCSMSLKNHF